MGNLCDRLCGSCCGDRPINININNPIKNISTLETNIGRNDDSPNKDETKNELILETNRDNKSKSIKNANKEVSTKDDKEKISDNQETKAQTSTKSGKKELELNSAKFYQEKIDLPP